MKYKLLLCLLINSLTIFGADWEAHSSTSSDTSSITKPKLGLVISYDDLSRCVHNELKDRHGVDINSLVSQIAAKSFIALDELKKRKNKGIIYWQNRSNGNSYGVEDVAVLENGIGYDSAIVRSELDQETKDYKHKKNINRKYNDKTREVVKKCGHAFHADCIEQAINFDSKCPACRTKITKKGLVVKFEYHKGESCAVCCESIVPSPVVAPKDSRFYKDPVASGAVATAGAGSAASIPVISPMRAGTKKRARDDSELLS